MPPKSGPPFRRHRRWKRSQPGAARGETANDTAAGHATSGHESTIPTTDVRSPKSSGPAQRRAGVPWMKRDGAATAVILERNACGPSDKDGPAFHDALERHQPFMSTIVLDAAVAAGQGAPARAQIISKQEGTGTSWRGVVNRCCFARPGIADGVWPMIPNSTCINAPAAAKTAALQSSPTAAWSALAATADGCPSRTGEARGRVGQIVPAAFHTMQHLGRGTLSAPRRRSPSSRGLPDSAYRDCRCLSRWNSKYSEQRRLSSRQPLSLPQWQAEQLSWILPRVKKSDSNVRADAVRNRRPLSISAGDHKIRISPQLCWLGAPEHQYGQPSHPASGRGLEQDRFGLNHLNSTTRVSTEA